MHDLARASLLGSVVAAALLGAAACWKVAPDSANDVSVEGSVEANLIESILVTPDGEGDGGSADGSSAESEAQPPPVIAATASPLLASGVGFGCRIDAAGAVWCWGSDGFGQAGSTPSSASITSPQQVMGVSSAVALALGDSHACAVSTAHTVYCWGLNDAYQLGHPAATGGDQICPGAGPGQTVPCSSTPSLVANLSDAVAIAAAGAWTCILATGGAVQCWGGVQQGVPADGGVACGLGTQASGGTCYPAPYTVATLDGATELAVGFDHACVIAAASVESDAGNQVSCWGNNNEGQVSPSACPQSSCTTPLARDDLPTTTSLATGDHFSCALASDGTVRCFGDNTYGQLGHTSGTEGDQGTALDGGLGVFNSAATEASATAVASLVGGGNEASCALLASGAAECWGDVASGGRAMPTVVSGLPPLNALGTFDGAYVCGLAAADGSPWCWTLGSSAAPQAVGSPAADGGG